MHVGADSYTGASIDPMVAQHQKRATRILTKKLGREPTAAEVAKKAKALAKKAAAAQE